MANGKQSENRKVKQIWRKVFLGVCMAGILCILLISPLFACTPETTTVTTNTTNVISPEKTVKIGFVTWYGSNTGLEALRTIKIAIDMDNQKGGLNIGGEKYKVELVEYDNNASQQGELAAVNKLVYEDKVKFIISEQGAFTPSCIPITEKNNVILLTTPVAEMDEFIKDDATHYLFLGGSTLTYAPIMVWYCQKHPDLTKNVVIAAIDNQFGHWVTEGKTAFFEAFGGKVTAVYYPETTQDLSSVATKVVSLNPTTVMGTAPSDLMNGLLFNAIRVAGYKGQIFDMIDSPAAGLKQAMSSDAIEGLICAAKGIEFDPPVTQLGKDFKSAWIAKYGSWEYPNIGFGSDYFCMKTALQQAGTIDVNKVAEVLSNGLEYETPSGKCQRIKRLDVGNARTVDAIGTVYVKQVVSGKPVLIDTIGFEDQKAMFKIIRPGFN
jgi:branched-chain amino acid transport system substrate-binding protein